MNNHASSFPIPSSVVTMLFRAAAARGLLKGRREAILARLEEMGRDLFPDGDGFYAALFAGSHATEKDVPTPALRYIGDSFWHASLSTAEQRRLEGSFYTPVPIIDRILDMVWSDLFPQEAAPKRIDRTLCDPAMGCGFFLLRAVERRLEENPARLRELRRWAGSNLFGVDLDAGAVFMARAFLWLALSDCRNEFIPDPGHFRCGDALLGQPFLHPEDAKESSGLDWNSSFPRVAAAGGFGVVVGNPPYEVLTNFDRKPERKLLAGALRQSGHYRDSLSGQINLYRCFIERSLDLLRPGGTLSMIVPLSLTRDAAALPLRRRLIEEERTKEWLLFGERDRLFPGVTQSACIFRAVKGAGPAETLHLTADGESESLPVAEIRAHTGEDLVIPAAGRGGARLRNWLSAHCHGRLGDVADMRVGEVDQTVYRDCMLDTDTGCLLARGAHLTAFRLDVNPLPGIGRFLDLPRFLAKKGASAEACRERAGVWRVVQLGIRNMHSRPRLVAALAPPGIYLGNSLNAYLPKGELPPEYLAGVLNSRLLDWLFRLASGNNNINLREMRRLPFPTDPSTEAAKAVIDAYTRCASAAEDAEQLPLARSVLDAAVAGCYGVPTDLLAGMHY